MRNLKKFLALALAMVMTFSLMLSASAAVKYSDYKDTADVTPAFEEAVKVLTGLEVLQGDGEEGNKNFRPQDDITRAEAAAIVYRVVTGDIKDAQVALYRDYGRFADVNENDWFAGYVGYCQNAGIIKGTTPTTFSPYAKVTGYEVLTMILRAVGYGKNNEFTDGDWKVKVASLAKTKHITDSVTSAQYNVTLNTPARREIVAELVFRGMQIPQVELTALGYSEYKNAMEFNGTNPSLAWEVFGLDDTGWKVIDAWGNPGYEWTAFRNPATNRVVATIEAKPSYEFHDMERECDVAHAVGDKDFTSWLYVNNKKEITKEYKIVATDEVTKVGGYGRLVKVYTAEDLKKQSTWVWTDEYYDSGRVWDADKTSMHNVVTMVDTMLAKVVSTSDAVKDKADHLITPAKLTVDVYAHNGANTPARRTIAKSGSDNWSYKSGDVILLNAYTDTDARKDQVAKEKAAFETNEIVADKDLKEGSTVVVLKEGPTSITGKQSKLTWNNGTHVVGGETKTDALTFDLDVAGTALDTTFKWYFDQYGYLVGIDNADTVRYGVITAVYAAFGTGDANTTTTGTAQAIATVQYADGTTGTEKIDFFMVHGVNVGDDADANKRFTDTTGTISDEMNAYVSSNVQGDNIVQLWPVYDMNGHQAMEERGLGAINVSTDIKPVHSATQGVVFMAPAAVSNNYSAGDVDANNLFGILNNNLFKFVETTGDKTVAVEVAGGVEPDYDGATAPAIKDTSWRRLSQNVENYGYSENSFWYEGHWAVRVGDSNDATLSKNLAYITAKGIDGTAAYSTVAWLEKDAKIIFRDADSKAIKVYNGLSELPGDIKVTGADDDANEGLVNLNEIDWADTNGNGRADIVYITGEMDGTVTYGLVYYNGGNTTWDGTNGTMAAWLNGNETTLTFTDLDEMNLIRYAAAADGKAGYDAHLFAVKMLNGVVTDVMAVTGDEGGTSENVLMFEYAAGALYDDPANNVVGFYNKNAHVLNDFETNIAGFENGGNLGDSRFGNPYTDNTEAVYYKDAKGGKDADGTRELKFVTDNLGGHVDVYDDGDFETSYWTNPGTKIYGIGAGVTTGTAALAYLNEYDLNDVTIIYENNSIIEIYVAIDPDITPSGRPSGEPDPEPGKADEGVGVTVLPEITDNDDLENAIRGMGPGSVVFSPDAKADGAATAAPAKELLYFPFTTLADDEADVTLTIYKDGKPVYLESAGTTVDKNKTTYFAINFVCGSNRNATIDGILEAGSYSFKIVGQTSGKALSEGTFTLG